MCCSWAYNRLKAVSVASSERTAARPTRSSCGSSTAKGRSTRQLTRAETLLDPCDFDRLDRASIRSPTAQAQFGVGAGVMQHSRIHSALAEALAARGYATLTSVQSAVIQEEAK